MVSDIATLEPSSRNNPSARKDTNGSAADSLDTILPANLDAEQGLLGVLLMDNQQLEKVSDFLKPEHFSHPTHQKIFEAIIKLQDQGLTADARTLKDYFDKDSALEDIGGARYLHNLANEVPLLTNALDYGKTIYDRFLRRKLICLSRDVAQDAHHFDPDRHANTIIQDAEAQLFSLAESGQLQGGFVSLRDSTLGAIEYAEKAFKTKGEITGITTGLQDLNHKLGGLHHSDLLILAARPSMGKTSLALNIAYNAAETFMKTKGQEGAIVGFFSLEMSADQLATRMLSSNSEIPNDAIRRGQISETDFRRFVIASQEMSKIPLYIDDTPGQSISAIRTRARRLKRQHGLGLIVIDYLQLLQGTGSRQGRENRVMEISEITRGLKALAKELNIPVIALSQLSRQVEHRDDKRPQLADLRESGTIEQDSDVVMFIYRKEYYLSREEPEKKVGEEDSKFNDRYSAWQKDLEESANIAEVIIAKQRHGPIGTVRLHFNAGFTTFSDLDQFHND